MNVGSVGARLRRCACESCLWLNVADKLQRNEKPAFKWRSKESQRKSS